jgi:V8-like Glu-specific endopeptidase
MLSTMPLPGSGYLPVRRADRKILTSLIAEQADSLPSGSSLFFEKLIRNANLPQDWAVDLEPTFRQKPGVAAELLVEWATKKKEHPREPRLTVLGSILRALLPKLGFSDARFVVAVISHYRLYQAADLEGLEMRYLVPQPAEQLEVGQPHGLETLNHGPDITWKGPAEETLELQRWLPATSALLDVGFLHRAMEQTAAICRLEFEGSERRGTGFLVGKHHVLTCYHVLKSHDGEDMEANGRRARLRFGCFANPNGDEAKGQVFKLAQRPIVKASPADQLDYVLLRADDAIAHASELRRVTWSLEAPQIDQALNILQHPEGDVMKIALCASGVAKLDSAGGRLQYATAAKAGSSGAPCFNDAWEVIAMHHAQRARALYSIREGILFSRILPEIKDQL